MDNRSPLLSDAIMFESKPIAVPYNYRISYKVAQLILILYLCCSSHGGCSLTKLHLISSALNSESAVQQLLDFSSKNLLDPLIVHFDPVINRALLYAISEEIVNQQKDGKFKLTLRGKEYASAIVKEECLMVREKKLLSRISTKITEKIINEIMSDWRYQNAKNQPNKS